MKMSQGKERKNLNFSSQQCNNNLNYIPASYSSRYPQPQRKLNGKDICFDNDSMLSSNMIAQTPQFSESQEEICDMFFNQKAYLQNQDKNNSNEEQSSNMIPCNNQDVYYDIDEANQNYEEEYPNQQEIYENDPYQIQIQGSNQSYENKKIGKSYQNYNFSNCVQIPSSINSQNQSNSQNGLQQQQINQSPCLSCSASQQNNQKMCQQCINVLPQQSSSIPKKSEIQNKYISSPVIRVEQQNIQPAQQNQMQNSPSNSQNPIMQKELKNEVQKMLNAPQLQDQSSINRQKSQKKQPIDNGIIDDYESIAEEYEQNSQNRGQYSLENSNYYSSDQSDSNMNNSSKHASCSYYNSEEQYFSGSQYNHANNDEVVADKKPRSRRSQNESLKDASSALNSKKAIKKYKPKKKYKQSRQKNVFKNFGNALMNCIQNNFVIRDFIEKRLGNDSNSIEAFHNSFLKDQLNHLKNKEDFLQGWRVQESQDDQQMILFKQVFKEVSLKFFNEYAAKYVNESDKLKNKDIHIKAIPIFIKGLQNVNELYKFKLS
ncbi:hypothetical protein TTHERM_00137650 (macronuclear) [Tetrahymena thermophila SB210]|uniref:Uncharacterized protein n=1 Tax=Tetrahymena thermophila (strain SB210) TaxID=312017 RepID=I7MKL3_TETTS|nr:hypothetical protein TTHERM_00137650 [Tetrahymena thermophila SB210]EAR99502.4 hypothetical protein TTHERM_00137650 [Tetrahymena thermophila SB210]|eukprot:XP_001019747.4 hypothetical protein TTHERM_00137650 [Tetrahymena thermophila SB210]